MTLVEVLVALMILSVTLLVFLDALRISNQTSRKGDYYAIAARTAGDQITQLQAGGFAGLVDGTTTYTASSLPGGAMTVVIGPLAGNSTNTNIKQIDITVTWTNAQMSGNVQMSTLIANVK